MDSAKKVNAREAFDRRQEARAAYFTACKFLGRGRYDTRRAPTKAAARELALKMGGGCLVYAVTPEGWSIHCENVSEVKEGEMNYIHCIHHTADWSQIKVVGHQTEFGVETEKFAFENGGMVVVRNEAALAALDGPQLLAVYNAIAAKPTARFKTREDGERRVWAALERKPEAATEPAADQAADETAGVPATAPDESNMQQAEGEGVTTQTPEAQQEEREMMTTKKEVTRGKAPRTKAAKGTKKAQKSAAPKKAGSVKKAAANGHSKDAFGLRAGSKASQAAAMFARTKGATMAEVKGTVGMNTYNLLKKLAENGHKVKKDGAAFYLS